MPCYDIKVDPPSSPLQGPPRYAKARYHVALAGSPNTGKTSLFNALTGLKARTANFPGTTVEHKVGRLDLGGASVELMDLPGLYSLSAATAEERVARNVLVGEAPGVARPDGVILLADASNIERSLFLASQMFEHDIPTILALNMMDIADHKGIHIDAARLQSELGCPVIPVVARTGKGVAELRSALAEMLREQEDPGITFVPPRPACSSCSTCPFQSRYTWSDDVASRCIKAPRVAKGSRTEILDRLMTHRVFGIAVFMAVMLAVFYMIFSVATVPMDLIDGLFADLGSWVAAHVPEGDLRSFLVDGVIGGVGGILVFLPQICILFLFLALLEDSGYLARAAFVMDRIMKRVGLPGTAFVPLLSAHACAIPAIMATRVIRDPRDRLVTILVAPLMTCSARIPVYAMVTALLFPANPVRAALLFTGAYALGIVAALAMAFLFKRSILPGDTKPLVLELPRYRIPSLRTALLYTYDRAKVFVQQAGTIILVLSMILWALATYPKTDEPAAATEMRTQAELLEGSGALDEANQLFAEADNLAARNALSHSLAGRMGRMIEPAVQPLGFDWQIGIGIVSSFAAREVIVSTLSIVYGLGEEADEGGLYDTLRAARHPDGSTVFTTATCISLLVFYVLAMQCLPTQAVTRRETNSWKWPVFQFIYMTVLAYAAAWAAYRLVLLLT